MAAIRETEWTAMCLYCGRKLYTKVGEEGICECGMKYIIVEGHMGTEEGEEEEYDFGEEYP